jgi:N utilization substance protein B
MTNKQKREARLHASIMLYQWDIGGLSEEEVVSSYSECKDKEVLERAKRLFLKVAKDTEKVDSVIKKYLKKGWTIERLYPQDKAILRLAVWELLNPQEMQSPPLAIINDAVEIAKSYGESEKSPKLINAILDKVFRERKSE